MMGMPGATHLSLRFFFWVLFHYLTIMRSPATTVGAKKSPTPKRGCERIQYTSHMGFKSSPAWSFVSFASSFEHICHAWLFSRSEKEEASKGFTRIFLCEVWLRCHPLPWVSKVVMWYESSSRPYVTFFLTLRDNRLKFQWRLSLVNGIGLSTNYRYCACYVDWDAHQSYAAQAFSYFRIFVPCFYATHRSCVASRVVSQTTV